MDKETKFYLQQLKPLVGGQVVGLTYDPEYGFVGLVIKTASGKKGIWFLRDDEGNGPGSFEIFDSEK